MTRPAFMCGGGGNGREGRKASEGMAEANNAVEIRYRMVSPRFNIGDAKMTASRSARCDGTQPTGMVSSGHQP